MAEASRRVPVIHIDSITKDFPSVRALDDVTLDIRRGEVHGLIGENGAGKSTLMRILTGLEQPTSGSLSFRGEPVHLRRPIDAQRLGIAMIHQELNLVESLTVAENIFLGREWRRLGLIAVRRTRREAKAVLDMIGARVDPSARVGALSIAQQQMVEIAKAISQHASVLIMDEPTAVLTHHEVQLLFDLISRLKQQGVTIIYISHILPEVLRICDRITVLRDGQLVQTIDDPTQTTPHELANLMVGREVTQQFPPRGHAPPDARLEVANLTSPPHVHDVSFTVHRGEIFGLAGLIGAGRTELAEALFGLRPVTAGTIHIDGEPIAIRDPHDAIDAGLAYLSEDRRGKGLHTGLSVAHNLTLISLERYCRPLIRTQLERDAAHWHQSSLGIRFAHPDQRVRYLSGGNQQKVALGKWLETKPRVLILDEPTRGIDVAAKAEIYRLIKRLTGQGMACIVISSEMNELIGLCHRIAVVRSGRIEQVIDGEHATEQQVMQYAAGVTEPVELERDSNAQQEHDEP